MSASASKPQDQMGASHPPSPEHQPTPSDHEPKPTNAGNLGGPVRQISDAARQNSERRAQEWEQRQKEQTERQNQQKQRDLWSAAGVPKRHKTMPNFTDEQLSACERMLDSFKSGAIWAILGEWGTGKTQMAAWVVRAACKQGRSARFTTAIEFFVRLRSPYRDDSTHRDESAVINEFTRFDLLVIDDAHVRADSDFENRLLHHVIDKRHGAMRETILTSNQSEAVFCDTIGGAVVDRMCAAGGIIECNWPSFRGKGANDDKT